MFRENVGRYARTCASLREKKVDDWSEAKALLLQVRGDLTTMYIKASSLSIVGGFPAVRAAASLSYWAEEMANTGFMADRNRYAKATTGFQKAAVAYVKAVRAEFDLEPLVMSKGEASDLFGINKVAR